MKSQKICGIFAPLLALNLAPVGNIAVTMHEVSTALPNTMIVAGIGVTS
jgi:hypothetical protein